MFGLPRRRDIVGGFSLLEALVALVIFSTALAALYAWIGVTLTGLQRVEASRQADEATAAGLAWVHTINPMTQPSGTTRVGHYRVRWEVERVLAATDGVRPEGGLSLFEVGLYELAVTVEGNSEPLRFNVRVAGWQQVREPLGAGW